MNLAAPLELAVASGRDLAPLLLDFESTGFAKVATGAALVEWHVFALASRAYATHCPSCAVRSVQGTVVRRIFGESEPRGGKVGHLLLQAALGGTGVGVDARHSGADAGRRQLLRDSLLHSLATLGAVGRGTQLHCLGIRVLEVLADHRKLRDPHPAGLGGTAVGEEQRVSADP